jgi:hypothetical protein
MILWEIGQEGGRTRPIDRDKLFKNLSDLWDVFQNNGIKCWLSHGTMLGVYRDGDFIPYDDDCDISAVMDTGNREKAEEELRELGFFVPPLGDRTKPVNPENNMPYSDTVAIRDGEKIEVWWFVKDNDKYSYDIYRPPACLVHDQKYYDDLKTISFKGKTFNIPNHIEDWLVMMYSDWKIPQKGRKYNNS